MPSTFFVSAFLTTFLITGSSEHKFSTPNVFSNLRTLFVSFLTETRSAEHLS